MTGANEPGYIATYCARCNQLRWHDFLKKPCQFCGNTEFATARPAPTFSNIDKRQLRSIRVTGTNEKEPKV